MNNSIYLKNIFILFFITLASVCEGQSITWQKVYEGPNSRDDEFLGIAGDNFGNSYLLGYTQVNIGSTLRNGTYIIKVNQYGDTLWTKIIGGYGITGQYATHGVCTSDGSIVFTGGRDTAYSACLSPEGKVLWNKTYPITLGNAAPVLVDIIQTSDNGYIMCGRILTQHQGLIIKIDSSGNLQWFKIHTAPFQKRYSNIIEVEGGYLLDGLTTTNGINYQSVFLKINFNGDIIWENQNTLFHNGFNPFTILQVNNFYWIFGNILQGLAFVKLDTSGIVRDSVRIPSPIDKFDFFNDALKINNNKYVVTSVREGPEPGDTGYAEAKIIDSLGVIHQSKLFIGYGYSQLRSSKKETNGDLTFAGFMYHWQENMGVNANGYAVRTDSNLNYPPVSIAQYSNLLPDVYILNQNYPNPFNPTTTISYSLPRPGLVTIIVYDITGKEVAKLVNEIKEAGSNNVVFTADNLSSGIYFYKFESEDFKETKQMILLK